MGAEGLMVGEQRKACANAQLAAAPEGTGEIKNEAEATEIEARLMEAEQHRRAAGSSA